jgi:hypothetical protein
MRTILYNGHATISYLQHIRVCQTEQWTSNINSMFKSLKEPKIEDILCSSLTQLPFQPPGPAYDAHLLFLSAMSVMLIFH